MLPIWAVENDAILSKMGDITIGYRVELPEIFSMCAAEYESFHHAWIKAIKLLPSHAVLYKQDLFTEGRHAGDFEKAHSFLSRSSERFFHERPYLDHDCFLFLTKLPRGRVVPSSAFSTLLRKHIVPVDTLDEKFFDSFAQVCGQFERVLCDTGLVRMKRMGNSELVAAVNRYLNLGTDLVLRDLSFDGGLQIGEKHCALFTMAHAEDLPSHCGPRITLEKYSTDRTKFSTGFASPVGQLLSCNHVYSQYLFTGDGEAAIKKLESKKLRLQSLSAYSRENAIGRDATDAFLQEAVVAGRMPVKAHFNVLAWTEKKEEVSHLRNLCAAALAQMDVVPKIETVGAPQIYWAGIPGNGADFPGNETFYTFSNQASCFFNLETNYRSSPSPIGLRVSDRISGRPLHIDLSDEPMSRGIITNRNKIIIGPSGSGKSYLTNHMVRSYYECGSHVVIVDVGHSYRGLCEMLGGTYFTYSETTPISFNPFHLGASDVLDTEKKESLKNLLIALWKKDDEGFNRSEYVALSNALQLYYAATIPFRCFDSFYEFLSREFVGVLAEQGVKEKDFDVSNFLYVLRPFYIGGEFDYLLNATENLDLLSQRFIVFELDNIKDHPILFPVVTIILMDVFIAKMRRLEGIRKVLLLEEVWKALARESMEEAIQYWVKTIRKYFGELWLVSQEIEDMISSAIVKNSIINNCDCKILLDQSKYQNKFSQVQELLGFSDKQTEQVLSINKANASGEKYKEAYFSTHNKVYRIQVSPEEHLCYTTEQTEKMKVMQAAKKFGSMEAGIKALLLCALLFVSTTVPAQIPIIGTIVAKVIKAIDLKVQKIQLQTMWLQNAQKEMENKLHALKLDEIRSWTDKQRAQYDNYFKELETVRSSVLRFQQAAGIVESQVDIVKEYNEARRLLSVRSLYTASEMQQIGVMHSGILKRSLACLDQLALASGKTSMTDGARLELVACAAAAMDSCLADMRRVNYDVLQVNDKRIADKANIERMRKLIGKP
ncbi:TraG family conjugative transposon ATPase [Sediminibacterium roseum]|nr:TraG family conjugative transposon ATPase [Sediminibacterium roseum]